MGEKKVKIALVVIGLILVAGLAWYFLKVSPEEQAAKDFSKLAQQVASDALRQYQIAKRNGNAMEACVHAGLVATAYMQAKDETNYQLWKKIQKEDCATAGISQ